MLHEAKTRLEIEKVIPDDKEVAENFKGFFIYTVPSQNFAQRKL